MFFVKAQLQNEKQNDTIRKLQKYAMDELDCSVASLAIAWVAKNKNVSTVLKYQYHLVHTGLFDKNK